MQQQKESLVYLRFFLKNKLLILLPAFFMAALTFVYQTGQRGTQHFINFYEVKFSDDKLTDAVLVTDEIVSMIRSRNFQDEILLPHGSDVVAYKSGPFSLFVDIGNEDVNLALNGLNLLEQAVVKKYPLKKIGDSRAGVKRTPDYFFLVLGFIGGLSAGVTASLIKYYFDNY